MSDYSPGPTSLLAAADALIGAASVCESDARRALASGWPQVEQDHRTRAKRLRAVAMWLRALA